MTSVSLKGLCVLVLEDDFFIAQDLSQALSAAGAEILGPYSSDDDAMASIERAPPDCAVLDIHVSGDGPKFAVARALQARGTPIIFATGYGREVLPSDLSAAVHLQKPFQDQQVVDAVTRACRASA